MSGTGLKSRGATGIFSLVALFLNLACENKVFRMNPQSLDYRSSGRDTPTSELWTTGSAGIRPSVFLNQGKIYDTDISGSNKVTVIMT